VRNHAGRLPGGPGSFAHWAPFLVILAAAFVDLASPREQRFDRFLAAAPALAASSWTVRGTAMIGLLAMLVDLGLLAARDSPVHPAALTSMVVISSVTVASCYVSHVRRRRERDLIEVQAVADTAQRVVLRPLPARLESVDLGVLYEGAAAQARIGGDFYEALRTPHGVRLIVGDVQGKGLAAVEVASVLLGSFREAAYDAPGLREVVRALETSMTRYAEQVPDSDAGERFATAVLLEVPHTGRRVRLLNLGHPAPVLLADGRARYVEPARAALPLNLSVLAPGDPDVEELELAPGERLLLYTDGISETRNVGGTFYPLLPRLDQWSGAPADQLLALLRADLHRYGAGPGDDIAALLVTRRIPGRP
jgi:hypothetical protein